MLQLTRRHMLAGGLGATFMAALAATSAPTASATTTVSLGDYGSTSSSDNTQALLNAVNAAGVGGCVTVPDGVWNFAGTANINSQVTIQGSSGNTCEFHYTAGAYGIALNGPQAGPSCNANGAVVEGIKFTQSGGATSAFVHNTANATVGGCQFFEPPMNAIDTTASGTTLTLPVNFYIGNATATGTAVYANNGANVTAVYNTTTGLYQGFYCVGAGDVSIKQSNMAGMWFYANRNTCAGTVASSTATSVTATSTLNVAAVKNPTTATVVAWNTVSTGVRVTPVSGQSGWFTFSGVTPEARMMVSNGSIFGVVLNTNGNQAYVLAWYDQSSCHLVNAGPSSATGGFTIERPYIGHYQSSNGSTVTVDAWHAGPKGLNQNPPKGSRLQINPRSDYQCYSTAGTKSFTVDSCNIAASWSDSISCMGGASASVTNNTIYDGQDVSITLERITGSSTASGNTAYRSGTAMVYGGSTGVVVTGNISNGANVMTNNSPSYSAFTLQGCPNASMTGNTAIYGGAPYEISGLSIDGYDGQDNSSEAAQQQGPWATNLTIQSNTFTGYPKYDVTIWGTKAYVKPGTVKWTPTPRVSYPSNATWGSSTPAMLGL